MSVFPPYAGILYDTVRRSFDPAVLRTEMERGLPKQRVFNTGVLMKLAMTLDFATPADAMKFENWYFDDIRRIGWFDFVHPLSGASLQVRFENGGIGELRPVEGADRPWQCDVTVEYLR
ncbi:hypothetical protein VC253_01520 [Xanthomonas campestris]|uniref:hypothetical protein n=1 Tax=Xanthomonas TaxID=338 RepID=UPI000CED843D|nr:MULTISPECIES: hypothetical protein [Xanthomonas]MEA9550542.1 hypothetical protein [Xanthomonas campestris]PPU34111.1 hypothetical protein XarbCFBP7604_09690 [Xanthomonas arboricola]